MNLRNIGEYIERVSKLPDGDYLVGLAYLASCNMTNSIQNDMDTDRELVRTFAKNLVEVLDDSESFEKYLEGNAISFSKKCRTLNFGHRSFSKWKSLYDSSAEFGKSLEYAELGRNLIQASDSLKKRLSQASNQSLEDQAVFTLNRYLSPVEIK